VAIEGKEGKEGRQMKYVCHVCVPGCKIKSKTCEIPLRCPYCHEDGERDPSEWKKKGTEEETPRLHEEES